MPARVWAEGRTVDAPVSVVMLEIPNVTPDSEGLYTAILAQLATSKYRVHRLYTGNMAFDMGNAAQSAAFIATRQKVEMVFWIQLEPDSCLLSFYFKDGGAKVFQRQMKLASDNLTGQYEVISNGVSSLIEETVFTVREEKRHAAEAMPAPPPKPAPPADRRTAGRVELSTAYNGALFSSQKVSSGVRIGLAVFVSEKTVLNLAFTQNATMEFETDRYRLLLRSRNMEAGVFRNLAMGSSQLRLGVSYLVQLRTFAMESRWTDLAPRPGKLHGIHGVEPSVQLLWPLAGKFLFDMGIGAVVCVNERGYSVTRRYSDSQIDTTRYDVVNPFSVKLMFQLGIIFQSK